MRLVLKILRWILIVVVVLVLLVGSGGYLWLRGALPQTSGSVNVQGLSAAIEIIRDTDSVPHIRATNEQDAIFGLGYVHAQDRLWQMEFQRRIGNGRLSEILGTTTIETDRFLRVMGASRAARSAWAKLDPATRTLVESYTAGVNSFISTHHGRQLPIEFTIFGFEPEPWQPEDTLVWAKMMAWNLGNSYAQEIVYSLLAGKLGPEKARQIMPTYSNDGPIILPNGSDKPHTLAATSPQTPPVTTCSQPSCTHQYDQLLAINQTIEDSLGLGGRAIGSNNWVIGGSRTTTGKPFLANDPHLGAQIPSIWYLAHITGGAIDVIGASIPGLPAIVIGHNNHIAWGVTNTGPDVQDLYLEHINEQDQVEFKGVWEPMQVIEEVIKVKDQPDTIQKVRITRHGPLISDVLDEAKDPMAMRWTALDDEDTTVQAYFGMERATNWEDFTAALSKYRAPMQNFVFADTAGNIGYYAPGSLPIRAKGNGSSPVPGWTGEYEWTSYVPFDELPHTYNPPDDFIATANNKVVPDSYPYLISTSWASPYRAQRIVEMIKDKPKLSIDDIAAMQADVHSALAQEILPSLLTAKAPDARTTAAIDFLKGWDGTIKGDSPQAAVYEAWLMEIGTRVFSDELGVDLWNEYRGWNDYITMSFVGMLKGQQSDWCNDITTAAIEDCATTLGNALSDGLKTMATYQGSDDFKGWRWDRVHQAIFSHNPLGNVPQLRPLFRRSMPNSGDAATVNVAPPRRNDPYNQYHVPSYRQIIDLSDLNNSRFMHTVGQSGYVLSSNYSDLLDRWVRVEYLPMRFAQDTINAAQSGRLTLQP